MEFRSKKIQRKSASKVKLNKRKKEAEIAGNKEGGSLREVEEEWQKALDE